MWAPLIYAMCSPVVLEGLVVARGPGLAARNAGVDVVSTEVVGVLGCSPLHEHRGLCVPGCKHLTRRRGDAYVARVKETISSLYCTYVNCPT